MNTNSSAVPHSLEGLLTHSDWVRALARRLVRDDAEADDVAQEVWRAAIERPPQHDANPRGWLAAVARNAARAMKRGDRRRTDRERATARPESLPSTTQLVEEASLSRELAGIVLQLEEPYRTTMLLRWFREMDVDGIADTLKLPRETVRTRLRRGLEMLREKLDADRGGRAAWLSAFVPLTRVDMVSSAAASGAIGGTWLWISLAASVALTAWIVLPKPAGDRDHDRITSHEPDRSGNAPAIQESGEEKPSQPAPTPDSSASTRTAVVASKAPSMPATEPGPTIEARIVDVNLHPLAGFVVEYRMKREPYWEGNTLHTPDAAIEIPASVREGLQRDPDASGLDRSEWAEPGVWETLTKGVAPRPRATSDADGLMRVSLPQGEWDRRFVDTHWTLAAILHPRNGPETWVAAQCVRVGGIVVDETDRPIATATIQLDTRWEWGDPRDKEEANGSVELFGTGTEVEADGSFTLECVPLGLHGVLRAWSDGYEPWTGPAPDHEDRALKIVLARALPKNDPHVRGVVLDADGRPFAGAAVQLGQYEGRSDAQGRFDLGVACCVEGRSLTASKRGHQPAILPNFGRAKMTDIEGVVLRLGGKPLAIEGRVLDAESRPIADCHFRLVEATQSGSTDLTIEELSSDSDEVRPRSGADGAFEIGGLLDREYTLIAWHEELGFIARKERVAAGARGVELRLDPSAFRARLVGSLVDGGGAPVAGARVALCLPKLVAPSNTWNLTYGSVTTGADGSFVLENVPLGEVGLWIDGDGLETISVPMPDQTSPEIRLVAKLLVRVQLNVADQGVDAIEFRDREDHPCDARIHLPDTVTRRSKVARVNGAFPPFDLGEAAVEAILLRADGTIVRRAPITIRRAKQLTLDL